MGWTINLSDGKSVDVGQLPISFFETQAAAEGVDWWRVYDEHPAHTISRFTAVLAACKEHLGADIPEFATMDDFVKFTNEAVEPTVPIGERPMVDGFPQEPGGTDPGSGSGAPGDSPGETPKLSKGNRRTTS